MFRPLRPIRPVRVTRPVGAPLVRGLVVGGAVYAAGRNAARTRQPSAAPAWQVPPGRAAAGPVPGAVPGAVPDIADKLAELGRMVRQGLLTPQEFAAAKARLLGG